MKIMVTCATGKTGSQVVEGLLEKDAEVFALTRSPERARTLPRGVAPVIGDFDDPMALRSALRGMDALFLVIAAGAPNEAQQGLTAVALAREAGIGRIVYLTVHQTPSVPRHVPHIGSKLLVESVIRESGIPFTFIQPNYFMQNDYLVKDMLLEQGIYPCPLGDVGASVCDVRDISAASVAALVEEGHSGKAYTIAGPDALTGADIAAIWSEALGRPVRYSGHDDMAAWEAAQIAAGLPPWYAFDLRLMFQAWQKGLIATAQELAELERLLGRPPRSYAQFAKEAAREWAAQAR